MNLFVFLVPASESMPKTLGVFVFINFGGLFNFSSSRFGRLSVVFHFYFLTRQWACIPNPPNQMAKNESSLKFTVNWSLEILKGLVTWYCHNTSSFLFNSNSLSYHLFLIGLTPQKLFNTILVNSSTIGLGNLLLFVHH